MIPTVSVVINTYNRARTLPATLAAMAWQRHPRFEVIVVNGPCLLYTSPSPRDS